MRFSGVFRLHPVRLTQNNNFNLIYTNSKYNAGGNASHFTWRSKGYVQPTAKSLAIPK